MVNSLASQKNIPEWQMQTSLWTVQLQKELLGQEFISSLTVLAPPQGSHWDQGNTNKYGQITVVHYDSKGFYLVS